VHQERLRGNFDARTLRQDYAAAMHDVEYGDRLARFALGVERIAAEIGQVEDRTQGEQDGYGEPGRGGAREKPRARIAPFLRGRSGLPNGPIIRLRQFG